MSSNDVKIERGSGNVFTDLGRPDADVQLLRQSLLLALMTSSVVAD